LTRKILERKNLRKKFKMENQRKKLEGRKFFEKKLGNREPSREKNRKKNCTNKLKKISIKKYFELKNKKGKKEKKTKPYRIGGGPPRRPATAAQPRKADPGGGGPARQISQGTPAVDRAAAQGGGTVARCGEARSQDQCRQ